MFQTSAAGCEGPLLQAEVSGKWVYNPECGPGCPGPRYGSLQHTCTQKKGERILAGGQGTLPMEPQLSLNIPIMQDRPAVQYPFSEFQVPEIFFLL